MPRRFLRYALDVVLLGAAVVAFLTGLLVDRLDLHQFAAHRWAGYVLAGLVAVHVAAHWRFFLAPFASRRRAPAPPQQGAAAGVSPAASEQVRSGPTRRAALAAAGAGAVGRRRRLVREDRDLARSLRRWRRRPVLPPAELAGSARPAAQPGRLGEPARPVQGVAGGAAVALPAARPLPELSVGQALYQRRSLRRYRDRMLTAQELAWLVHAATAITSADGYRTAPSAGALYPIETYVAVSRVQGIDAGLYHVDVRAQALEPVRAGPVAGDLMIAGPGPGVPAPGAGRVRAHRPVPAGAMEVPRTPLPVRLLGRGARGPEPLPRRGSRRAGSVHGRRIPRRNAQRPPPDRRPARGGARPRRGRSPLTRQCGSPASPATRQLAYLIRRVPAISSRSTAWARPDSPSSCCPWVATAGPTRGRAPQAAGRPPRRAGRRRNALSRPCGPPRRISQLTPCETITLATVRDRTGCISCSPPPRSQARVTR